MTTTSDATALEELETARHEAGRVLAYWWHGQPLYAVEMRRHEEGRQRPETAADIDPALWREMVARDMLAALAGPAAEWRNARDPEPLGANLMEMLDAPPASCLGSVETVDSLLALLPEEERHEVYATACLRAEVLVCRHWPELCAVADHLASPERLEDEALAAVLSETLGELSEWRARPLEDLDVRITLGDAEVVAGWDRYERTSWSPWALVDGLPLLMPLKVVRLAAGQLEDEPKTRAPGWYCLDLASGEVHAGPPPAVGTLPQFLADLVGDKLDELRRDPDSIERMEADS